MRLPTISEGYTTSSRTALWHACHSAGNGAVLKSFAGSLGGLTYDSPLNNNDNGLAAEFLLQLAHESLLDATVLVSLTIGDEKNNRLQKNE